MEVPKDAIELSCFFTWMGKDGICRTLAKTGAEVGIEDAKANSIAVNSFFLGKKYPLLVDSRKIKYISREARDHFSIKGRDTKINAFGIIVDSALSRVIGNFFMGINKPSVPARLFDSEESAVIWLKKFLDGKTETE